MWVSLWWICFIKDFIAFRDTFGCKFYTWFSEDHGLPELPTPAHSCFLFSSCDVPVVCAVCASGPLHCQWTVPANISSLTVYLSIWTWKVSDTALWRRWKCVKKETPVSKSSGNIISFSDCNRSVLVYMEKGYILYVIQKTTTYNLHFMHTLLSPVLDKIEWALQKQLTWSFSDSEAK